MPLIVTGVRETLRSFGAAVRQDAVKVAVGMDQCARELLVLSQFYVPKDTLALHDSAKVVQSGRGITYRVAVEYGGSSPNHDVDVDYAMIVHNDLATPHEPPTSAMYLSRAAVQLMPRFAQIMSRSVRSKSDVIVDEGRLRTATRGMRS